MVICKKKEKTRKRQADTSKKVGDHWGYTAIKRRTKLHIGHALGKRNQKTCDKLIKQLKARGKKVSTSKKAKIISDGNDQYLKAIKKTFSKDTVNYAQLVKVRQGGRLVQKIKKNKLGRMNKKNIETTVVEKYNGTLRDNVTSLVRKTSGFAKIPEYTNGLLDIHQVYQNLIKLHPALTTPTRRRRTPAMKEKLTGHRWNWLEVLQFKEYLL